MDLYERYKTKLAEAVAIKSISTDTTYQSEIHKMVDWCKKELENINFKTKVVEGYNNPIVFGEYIVDKKLPTILHYGHYDVQPASQEDGWDSNPFELRETTEKLFARGVLDNKGQFIVYITVLEHLIESNKLGYNIKFIIEGNEETGSPNLAAFMSDFKDDLKCDFALASDGEMQNGQPSMDVSFRGNVNSELTVWGPKNQLHSGIYGGITINPLNVIVNVLSKLANNIGDTKVLEKNIAKPTSSDKERMLSNTFDFEEYTNVTGIEKPIVTNTEEIYKRIGFLNSVQLTGLSGGYTNDGFMNAIAKKAVAKINFRHNFGISSSEVVDALHEFFKANIPENIKYDFVADDLAQGVKLNMDNKYAKMAAKILKNIHSKEVFYNYCGGTLPVAYDVSETLKVPFLMVGMGNGDCNMHGPNENFDVMQAKNGLKFVTEFLEKQ